jgi:hypothetical protein
VRQLDGSEDALLANFDKGDPEGLAAAATARDHTVLNWWRTREELRGVERESLCLQAEVTRHALTTQLKLSSLNASPVDPDDPSEARAAESARRAAQVAQSLADWVTGHHT